MGSDASIRLPSDRHFGLLFTLVFAIASGYAGVKSLPVAVVWLLGGTSALTLSVSLIRPQMLSPFNRAWHQLGMVLDRVVSPVMLGVIFILLITPVAVCTRLAGRDALRLRKRNVQSHWVERVPKGPVADSFKNQF